MNVTKILAISISMFFSCLAFTMQEENLSGEQIEQKKLEKEVRILIKSYINPKLLVVNGLKEEFYRRANEKSDELEYYNYFTELANFLKKEMKFFVDYIKKYELIKGKDNSKYMRLLVIDEALNDYIYAFMHYTSNLARDTYDYIYYCPFSSENYERILNDPWFEDERKTVGMGRWRKHLPDMTIYMPNENRQLHGWAHE